MSYFLILVNEKDWLKMPNMKLQDMKIQDMNLQDMTNIIWKYITMH